MSLPEPTLPNPGQGLTTGRLSRSEPPSLSWEWTDSGYVRHVADVARALRDIIVDQLGVPPSNVLAGAGVDWVTRPDAESYAATLALYLKDGRTVTVTLEDRL